MADLGVMERDAKRMRGDGPTVFAQARQGVGLEEVIGHILASWQRATGATAAPAI